MKNQPTLFYYQCHQRKTAKYLVLNMLVILVMYLAALQWLNTTEASGAELMNVINIAVPIVEVLLLSAAIWFWRNNDAFWIAVTPSEMEVHDPLSQTCTWRVLLVDIIEIKHEYKIASDMTEIKVCCKNGEIFQLTKNYPYDRKALYQALAKARPAMVLPENAYLFKKTK